MLTKAGVAISLAFLVTAAFPAEAAQEEGSGNWSTSTPWWCYSGANNCQFYTTENNPTSVFRTCSTAGGWPSGWKSWQFIDSHSCS